MFHNFETANHEKMFLNAVKNGNEFSPGMKNACCESTNESTDMSDENGYRCDDKNNFFEEKDFAENRLIQVHKIELVHDQEKSKKSYEYSRSAVTSVQMLKEYRIVLTKCKDPKVQLYQESLNILKTNRKFAAHTEYVVEYKI